MANRTYGGGKYTLRQVIAKLDRQEIGVLIDYLLERDGEDKMADAYADFVNQANEARMDEFHEEYFHGGY